MVNMTFTLALVALAANIYASPIPLSKPFEGFPPGMCGCVGPNCCGRSDVPHLTPNLRLGPGDAEPDKEDSANVVPPKASTKAPSGQMMTDEEKKKSIFFQSPVGSQLTPTLS
ncbi:hypothetical protein BDZ85DRAFT_264648, partial [Elsinoe ampelina]